MILKKTALDRIPGGLFHSARQLHNFKTSQLSTSMKALNERLNEDSK
ncbi:MAG: hypothetical protein J1E82_09815 [Muribaculaceae bacterium]|nr:hypothetical protein [Muribaculaceae bacterium]